MPVSFEGFPDVETFYNVVKYGGRLYETPIRYRGKIKLHGCFSADTPITMGDGSQKPIADVQVGDVIRSFDFERGEHVSSNVTHRAKMDGDKAWIELEFDNGVKLRCTTDHRFFTQNRGWVEAQNLTTDDVFVTP